MPRHPPVTGWAPSDQEASAGRINVEISGPERLAAIASAASAPTLACRPPCGAPIPRRCPPARRCRIPVGRRIFCDRWRGRRRQPPSAPGPGAHCAGWPARCPVRGRNAQHRRRTIGHAGLSVGRTRGHALKSASTPRIRGTVSSAATKCISEYRGWRAHVDAAVDQGIDQRLGTVHLIASSLKTRSALPRKKFDGPHRRARVLPAPPTRTRG